MRQISHQWVSDLQLTTDFQKMSCAVELVLLVPVCAVSPTSLSKGNIASFQSELMMDVVQLVVWLQVLDLSLFSWVVFKWVTAMLRHVH